MNAEDELYNIILGEGNTFLFGYQAKAIAKAIIDAGYIHMSQAPDYCEPAPYILASGRRGVVLKPEVKP